MHARRAGDANGIAATAGDTIVERTDVDCVAVLTRTTFTAATGEACSRANQCKAEQPSHGGG